MQPARDTNQRASMAVSESQLNSGHRLAGDLRSIRRKKGVDLKEVLDATRLADDVIEALEENGLVNHPAFNKVYLRSLYGAYGDAISVRREDMLQALEEVFAGNYIGSLARKYLGVPNTEPPSEGTLPETAIPEGAESEAATPGKAPAEGAFSEADAAAGSSTRSDEDPGAAEVAVDNKASQQAPDTGKGPVDQPAAEERRLTRTPEPEERMDDRVWQGLPQKGRVLLPNMSGTALVAIAAVAFISFVWFAVSSLMDMREESDIDGPAQDTTQVVETVRPAPVILPDSFRVDIVALIEALDPIRITVDRDLRRPYWIEHLDTMPFLIVDRMEREVGNARVIADGFRVPESWLAGEGVVELTRTRIQGWLDSLTTAGVVPRRDAAYR